jgi:hypothetical protein
MAMKRVTRKEFYAKIRGRRQNASVMSAGPETYVLFRASGDLEAFALYYPIGTPVYFLREDLANGQ